MLALDFLAPSAAWLGLLAVPLIALYFLKLRRPRLELSSTVLWRAVLRDERVNSPLRRLRQSLLLWLQLLLLAALVLAAMQPQSTGGSEQARTVVLVDVSASMAARERAAGPTRLDLVRAQAKDLITALQPQQQAAIVACGAGARLITPFTSDKRELRDGIDTLQVEDVAIDLAAALRIAQGLGQTAAVDRVVLLSDGNVPAEVDFDLPFEVEYVRVPRGGANVGITSLHAARDGDVWRVAITVEATGAAAPCTLRVRHAGNEAFAEPVALRAGEAQRFVFPLPAGERAEVEAKLDVQGFDALAADDVGRLVLERGRPLRVQVSPRLADWRRALAAQPDAQVADTGGGEGVPDLVVSDRAEEADVPGAVGFVAGSVPPALAELIAVTDGGSAVVDWRRSEPLLQHVELADLIVLDRVEWRAPGEVNAANREGAVEQLGWEVLVHGDRGPLLLRRGRGLEPGLLFVMPFASERSTMPYRVGFPMLAANLTGIARSAAGLREVAALRASVLPPIAAGGAGRFVLRGPLDVTGGAPEPGAAAEVAATAGEDGRLHGLAAPRAGWYELSGPGKAQRLGVNLLRRDESLLEVTESLRARELSVEGRAGALESPRPLWTWLGLLALLLLLLEWWMFRKPAPARAPSSPATLRPGLGR